MFGWGKTKDDSTAIFAATTEARLQSFEQRLARLEVEVRDMHGTVMELRGQMAVDSHFDQMIKRLEAVERSSEAKANSIGRLEGRIEGVFQILAGLKDALARSSDERVSQAAKNISVNTFVNGEHAIQLGKDSEQHVK